MTEEDFEKYLVLYGADLSKWPADRAALAHDMINQPWARAQMSEMAQLDDMLIGAGDISLDDVRLKVTKATILEDYEAAQLFKPKTLIGSGLAVAASMLMAVMLSMNSSASVAEGWENDYTDFAFGFVVDEQLEVLQQPVEESE